MHNSENSSSRRWTAWILVAAMALLAACTQTRMHGNAAEESASLSACLVVQGTPSPADTEALAVLRRAVEAGPLYVLSSTTFGRPECQVTYQPEGAVSIEYGFRDGGWLRVQRDPRIEYTEQSARFYKPLTQQPKEAQALLARAANAAYGPNGCGIDWAQPEIRPDLTEPGMSETIFKGDVCQCQARIRRNPQGQVSGLSLAGTC